MPPSLLDRLLALRPSVRRERAAADLLAACREAPGAQSQAAALRAIADGALDGLDPCLGQRPVLWEALIHGHLDLARALAGRAAATVAGPAGGDLLLRAARDEEMPWPLRAPMAHLLMDLGAAMDDPQLLGACLDARLDSCALRIVQSQTHLGPWSASPRSPATPLAALALALGNPDCALALLARSGSSNPVSLPTPGHPSLAGPLIVCALLRDDKAARPALPAILALMDSPSEALAPEHAPLLASWLANHGPQGAGAEYPPMAAIHGLFALGAPVVDAARAMGATADEVARGVALLEERALALALRPVLTPTPTPRRL